MISGWVTSTIGTPGLFVHTGVVALITGLVALLSGGQGVALRAPYRLLSRTTAVIAGSDPRNADHGHTADGAAGGADGVPPGRP